MGSHLRHGTGLQNAPVKHAILTYPYEATPLLGMAPATIPRDCME